MRDERRLKVCSHSLYPQGFPTVTPRVELGKSGHKRLSDLYTQKDFTPVWMLLMPEIKMVNEGLPTSLHSGLLSWENPT